MSGTKSIVLFVSASLYFLVNVLVLNYLHEHGADKPYMDEIFHVPQAQAYCLGNYSEVRRQTSQFHFAIFRFFFKLFLFILNGP